MFSEQTGIDLMFKTVLYILSNFNVLRVICNFLVLFRFVHYLSRIFRIMYNKSGYLTKMIENSKVTVKLLFCNYLLIHPILKWH